MVHYTRVQGLTDLPTEVAEVARAARDVGVRVGFAVAMRDRNPLVYGPSEPILAALVRTRRAKRSAAYSSVRRFLRSSSSRWSMRWRPRPRARPSTCNTGRRRAVVHARAARSDRGRLAAHRPARPHASPRDPLLSAPGRTAKYPEGILRYLDRIGLLEPAADARPLHLGAARRARADRRAWRHHLGQHQLEPGICVRASRRSRRWSARLPRGARPRRLDARRGRRCAARDAARASPACRHGLSRSTSTALRCCGWRSRTAGARSPTRTTAARSRPASRPNPCCSIGMRSMTSGCGRTSIRSICCSRAATVRHIHELIVAGRSVVRDGQVHRHRLSGDARRDAGAVARRHAAERRASPLRSASSNARSLLISNPSRPAAERSDDMPIAKVHRISASAPDDVSGIDAAIAARPYRSQRRHRGARQDRGQRPRQRLCARLCHAGAELDVPAPPAGRRGGAESAWSCRAAPKAPWRRTGRCSSGPQARAPKARRSRSAARTRRRCRPSISAGWRRSIWSPPAVRAAMRRRRDRRSGRRSFRAGEVPAAHGAAHRRSRSARRRPSRPRDTLKSMGLSRAASALGVGGRARRDRAHGA